jgi:hypothetical protein
MLTCLDYLLASTEFSGFVRLASDFAQMGQWGDEGETEHGMVRKSE